MFGFLQGFISLAVVPAKAGTHNHRAWLSGASLSSVMPGLDPGIHALARARRDVDGRDKPGHDAWAGDFLLHYAPGLWVPAFAGTTVLRHRSIFSRRNPPELCLHITLAKSRGRREGRVAAAPGAPAQNEVARGAWTTGTGGDNRPSLRDGLRLISRSPR